VQKAIEESRNRSYQIIVRRLHAAYIREALALRDKKLADFDPSRRAVVAGALAKISVAYQAYTDQVGPKYATLAVIAGFPDPDPNSRRKQSTTDGMAAAATKKAAALRVDIAARNQAFQDFSKATLQTAEAETNAQLKKLLADIAQETANADARASTAARAEVKLAQAQIGQLLADKPMLEMPAVPESRMTTSPGPTRGSQVRLPEGANQPLTADSPELVKSDLDVWLAVNRYQLGRKDAARNATQEFVAWRSQFERVASTQR
jgi:hypothetical protein